MKRGKYAQNRKGSEKLPFKMPRLVHKWKRAGAYPQTVIDYPGKKMYNYIYLIMS